MANLFAKAKGKAETKTTKDKDKKVRIRVADNDFFEKVTKLETLQERMKADKAKADMIADELRDTGKSEWAKLFEKTGKNPGSVMLENVQGEDTAQLMFVPTDKYITITPERADALKEEYGDTIVEEKTTFAFDNEMVDKYGEVISSLIEACGDISDEDKAKIIKAVTVFSVAKGTIDKLNDYGAVAEVMENVKPVVALKNVGVIKG